MMNRLLSFISGKRVSTVRSNMRLAYAAWFVLCASAVVARQITPSSERVTPRRTTKPRYGIIPDVTTGPDFNCAQMLDSDGFINFDVWINATTSLKGAYTSEDITSLNFDFLPYTSLCTAGCRLCAIQSSDADIYCISDRTSCSDLFTLDTSTQTLVEPVLGCTDPLACNYDPNASHDDGSCFNDVPAGYCDCEGNVPLDACGVCNGPGDIYECGCEDVDVLAGYCDCDGNTLDALAVCGGTCSADANADGVCDEEESPSPVSPDVSPPSPTPSPSPPDVSPPSPNPSPSPPDVSPPDVSPPIASPDASNAQVKQSETQPVVFVIIVVVPILFGTLLGLFTCFTGTGVRRNK